MQWRGERVDNGDSTRPRRETDKKKNIDFKFNGLAGKAKRK